MTADRDAVVRAVRVACERPDAPAAAALLAPGAVAWVDSGGDVPAELLPVDDPERIAQLLLSALAGAALAEHQVNGLCALVGRRDGRVTAIVSLDVRAGAVNRVWITLSPLKLRRWN